MPSLQYSSTIKPILLPMPILSMSFLLVLSQVFVAAEGAYCEGYNETCRLKIAVPGNATFKAFVNITSENPDRKYSGFCIDVFNTSVKRLGCELPYRLVEFWGTYDELVKNVTNKTYSAAVGDITILADRFEDVVFTVPFTESGLTLVLPLRPGPKGWIFLKPFSWDTWLTIAAALVYTMLTFWFLEHREPDNTDFNDPRRNVQFGNALWFTFSSLFLAHSKEQNFRWTHTAADLTLPRACRGTIAGLSAFTRDGSRGPQYPREFVQLRGTHLAANPTHPRDYRGSARGTLAGPTALAMTLAGLFYPHEIVQLHGAPLAPCHRADLVALNHSVGQLLAICQSHDLSTRHHVSGEKIQSNYSRIVAVAWLFLALVLTQTYTANLTTMLTNSRLQPKIWSQAKVGCDENTFIKKYVQEVLHYKNVITIKDEYEYLRRFNSGDITAAYLESPYAKVFTNKYCGKFIDTRRTQRFGGFGFIFGKHHSPLAANFSKVILQLSEEGLLTGMESYWLTPNDCSESMEDTDSLSLRSLWGLFVFSIGTSSVCFLLCLGHLLRNYLRHQNKESGPTRNWMQVTRSIARYIRDAEIKHRSPSSRGRVVLGEAEIRVEQQG